MQPIQPNESICPVCGRSAFDGKTHPICRTKYTPEGLISFFRYSGVVKKAVKELKYRYVSDLAGEFASLFHLNQMIKVTDSSFTIVPIPLHPERLRFRGFNQSEVLSGIISEKLHIPVRTDLLARLKKTAAQAELHKRKERLKNMDHVFGSTQGVNGFRIILVDDVYTTGATMLDATKVLKQAGAKSVLAVTIAR